MKETKKVEEIPPFKLPVNVIDESLEDANGKVICHFAWLEESAHIARARKNANYVAKIINDKF